MSPHPPLLTEHFLVPNCPVAACDLQATEPQPTRLCCDSLPVRDPCGSIPPRFDAGFKGSHTHARGAETVPASQQGHMQATLEHPGGGGVGRPTPANAVRNLHVTFDLPKT